MNGTQISEQLRIIEEIEGLLFTDIQQFCTFAYNNKEYAFGVNYTNFTSPNLHAQAEILEIKIKEDTYDEEAVQIAKKFIGEEQFYFLNELNKKRKKYEKSVRKQITRYTRAATALKLIQQLLQLAVIIGAASVPLILSDPTSPREISTYISIGVAVSAAILKFYRFQDHIQFHETAAAEMQREYIRYTNQRDIYAPLSTGAALDCFMDKIDELRQKTHELSLFLDKSSQDQMQDQIFRLSKSIPETHHNKDTQ